MRDDELFTETVKFFVVVSVSSIIICTLILVAVVKINDWRTQRRNEAKTQEIIEHLERMKRREG